MRQGQRRTPCRAIAGALAFALAGFAAPARAADAPLTPPPLVPAPPPAAAPAPADVTPPVAPPAPVAPEPSAAPAPDLAERRVPTADSAAAESDHEAVRDSWGVQVRPVAARLSVFGLRPGTGCPASVTTPPTGAASAPACPPLTVSALAARRWLGRNVAVDGGLALALGGGSDGGRLLDTYFGAGPVIGASVLLANWRHVAVMAGPELTFVVFKGASSADVTYFAELLGSIEAELHFGFIGAPALSLSVRSGVAFRLEHAADATLWSLGVAGATTVRALFEDVALRYYF